MKFFFRFQRLHSVKKNVRTKMIIDPKYKDKNVFSSFFYHKDFLFFIFYFNSIVKIGKKNSINKSEARSANQLTINIYSFIAKMRSLKN